MEQNFSIGTVGEFFGTLQESVVIIWRAHLMTSSYAAHIALNEYYEGILDKADSIIECYQGLNGKVKEYKNTINDFLDPISYLETLRDFTRAGRAAYCEGNTELESCCDDILSLMDSTLYKLRELK